MKRSSKIVLYGSLISVLYIILCLYIQNKEFIEKSENITKREVQIPIIETNGSNMEENGTIEKMYGSTLNYKIENGVITIAGHMPILEDDDALKTSMMKFCVEDYCDRTIIFSADRETPTWKNLAKDIINLFYEENLTNASFFADEHGNINIEGELLSKSSKDKIVKIVQTSGQSNINDKTHLKILQPKKREVQTNIDKNETNKTLIIDGVSIAVETNTTDNIEMVQKRVSEFLKDRKINFYRNRAKITPRGVKTLNRVVELLKDVPNIKIEVRGYTDASGKREINRWISRERAKSVKNYLGSHGIAPKSIEVKGFGESDLLYKDKPYSPLNRRVEIEIKRR